LFLSTVAFQETFHFSVPQQTLNFLFQSPKAQKPKNTNFAFFSPLNHNDRGLLTVGLNPNFLSLTAAVY
jgi:hypothetical protein